MLIKTYLLEQIPNNISGVYILDFNTSVYIGASCNILHRINSHIRKLKKNKHSNTLLQSAYDKYNIFEIKIIECDKKNIYKIEHNLVNDYKNKDILTLNIQSPPKNIPQLTDKHITKILSKIDKQKDGCWFYKSPTTKGYPQINLQCKKFAAHRVIYTYFQRQKLQDQNWNIPDNLILRHLCHNKLCCNPDHLKVGTDQDNMLDSVGRPRKRRSNIGQLLTAWGEAKHFSEWMLDSRKNPELQANTIRARLSKMSVEDALTKPLYRKYLTEQERKDRIQKRLIKEQNNKKKFQTAAAIMSLYVEGEHIDDLIEFFNWLKPIQIKNIINKRQWYNPSFEAVIPKDYIRIRRTIPPKKIPEGLFWENGYYSAHVKIKTGVYVSTGKCKNPEEALQKKRELEKFRKDT